MKFEIINPSDECYVEADEKTEIEAACAAVLLVGRGRYALNSPDGETVLPIFMFQGQNLDEWWTGRFGHVFADYFVAKNYAAVAKVLKTFSYARERSSMNDIGKAAEDYVRVLEKKSKEASASV